MKKRVLAVIPARGGSKRLLSKNIKNFNGKPLIVWTIEAALGSTYITDVVVSTDDHEIANEVKRYGDNLVPFLRPEMLATDNAKTIDVIQHAYQFMGENRYDIVCILQPTSPLRTSLHIDEAIQKFINLSAFSIVSITECEHNPLWSGFLSPELNLNNFIQTKKFTDDYRAYRLNGAIYVLSIDALYASEGIYNRDTFGYVMDRDSSIDIDTIEDFTYAEYISMRVRQ